MRKSTSEETEAACSSDIEATYSTDSESEESNTNSITFLELSDDEQAEVEHALSNGLRIGGSCLLPADLQNIYRNDGWLGDEVINCFVNLLNKSSTASRRDIPRSEDWDLSGERIHIFPTFFYTLLEKSISRVDSQFKSFRLEDYDLFLFPVNPHNSHWVLVAVQVQKKLIFYMDPLCSFCPDVLSSIHSWL